MLEQCPYNSTQYSDYSELCSFDFMALPLDLQLRIIVNIKDMDTLSHLFVLLRHSHPESDLVRSVTHIHNQGELEQRSKIECPIKIIHLNARETGWWTPLLNRCKEIGMVLLLMPHTQTFGFRNTLQSVITEGGPSGEIVLSSMDKTHRELVLEGLAFQKEHTVLHLMSETERMCLMNCLATRDVQTVRLHTSPRTVNGTGQTSTGLKHFQLEDCNQCLIDKFDLSNVHCDVLSLSPTDYSYLPPSTLPIAFTNKMISPSVKELYVGNTAVVEDINFGGTKLTLSGLYPPDSEVPGVSRVAEPLRLKTFHAPNLTSLELLLLDIMPELARFELPNLTELSLKRALGYRGAERGQGSSLPSMEDWSGRWIFSIVERLTLANFWQPLSELENLENINSLTLIVDTPVLCSKSGLPLRCCLPNLRELFIETDHLETYEPPVIEAPRLCLLTITTGLIPEPSKNLDKILKQY